MSTNVRGFIITCIKRVGQKIELERKAFSQVYKLC